MENANLKTSFFKECKGFCILLLGFIVVMGGLLLVIAAILSLGTYVPSLTPVATEGQTLVTGCFLAIMQYPVIFILLLAVGGYALQRLGWADWF
jgi:MFS superfamily sulfate permease-like transporter